MGGFDCSGNCNVSIKITVSNVVVLVVDSHNLLIRQRLAAGRGGVEGNSPCRFFCVDFNVAVKPLWQALQVGAHLQGLQALQVNSVYKRHRLGLLLLLLRLGQRGAKGLHG